MDSSHSENESYGNVICLEDSIEVIDLSQSIIQISRNEIFKRKEVFQKNHKGKKRKNEERNMERNVEPIEVIDLSNDCELTTFPSKRQNAEGYDMCCPVCLRSYKNLQLKATYCGHVFCSECIDIIVKQTKTCPLCRKKLTTKKLILLHL